MLASTGPTMRHGFNGGTSSGIRARRRRSRWICVKRLRVSVCYGPRIKVVAAWWRAPLGRELTRVERERKGWEGSRRRRGRSRGRREKGRRSRKRKSDVQGEEGRKSEVKADRYSRADQVAEARAVASAPKPDTLWGRQPWASETGFCFCFHSSILRESSSVRPSSTLAFSLVPGCLFGCHPSSVFSPSIRVFLHRYLSPVPSRLDFFFSLRAFYFFFPRHGGTAKPPSLLCPRCLPLLRLSTPIVWHNRKGEFVNLH